jgi:hypothetical protein
MPATTSRHAAAPLASPVQCGSRELRLPTQVATALIRSRGINGLYRQWAGAKTARHVEKILVGTKAIAEFPRRERNDRHHRGALVQRPDRLEPFRFWHEQVDDHGVEIGGFDGLEAGAVAIGEHHLEAFQFQHIADCGARGGVAIDNEHAGHGGPGRSRRAMPAMSRNAWRGCREACGPQIGAHANPTHRTSIESALLGISAPRSRLSESISQKMYNFELHPLGWLATGFQTCI